MAGCGGGQRADKPIVIAAVYPLSYLAERVAGDGYDVVNITPPGAEPHDLELTVADVKRIHDASLVIYVEAFQPALERAVRESGVPAVLLGGGPHSWLFPRGFADSARVLGGQFDRGVAAEEVASEAERLHREYQDGLRRCQRRSFVVSHAAFGYLAFEYRLRQIPIAGTSPEAEPAPQQLKRIVERVRDSGATTIFTEPLVSPRLAETIARETGAEVATLDPLESEPEEGDYFTVMRANLAALRKALGCR